MKISKLFHWLYAILMFLPFGFIIFNLFASMWSGQVIDYNTWVSYVCNFENDFDLSGVCISIRSVYSYLMSDVFGFSTFSDFSLLIENLLTYWTFISILWLVFDVFMYVPLLVHRWIDKAKIE